ncbi:prephenate dehydrogenase [Acidaminococcus sp. CAG:917]|nr:prephenate dehydrogenase [Acidaminococcus sp. CAG:917]
MKIGIVGLGLIGASMAKALSGAGHTVLGDDIDADVLKRAVLTEAISARLDDINVKSVDMLILSVYPDDTVKYLSVYAPLLKDGAVLADLCGIKREIVAEMKRLKNQYPAIEFIGLHPMAGKEYSGFKYSSPLLFENASLLAVPVDMPLEVLAKVKQAMLEIGFKGMVITTAEEHDKIISYTSQLAHIVSSSYVQNEMAKSIYGFTAGSFRDMTRVARLNPVMWTQLLMQNRDMLSLELSDLIQNLTEFKDALDGCDDKKLCEKLEKGNRIKCEIEKDRVKKTKESYDN